MMGASASVESFKSFEYSRSLAKYGGISLALLSIIIGTYSSYVLMGYRWIWYSYHPSSMVAAFLAMSGNAILIKKMGGYENTKMHGYLMTLASLLAGAGFYVIYTNKIMQGKNHFMTTHGKIGLGLLLGYLSMGLFGFIGLNPDWGYFKTDKRIRLIHKMSGRVLTFIAWYNCFTGFSTTEKNQYLQASFGISLLIFSFFVLM